MWSKIFVISFERKTMNKWIIITFHPSFTKKMQKSPKTTTSLYNNDIVYGKFKLDPNIKFSHEVIKGPYLENKRFSFSFF